MKLQTSIKPRNDGTVTVSGLNGAQYVFAMDTDGELTCEVDHAPTVKHLIEGGLFFPCEEADFENALAIAIPQSELSEADDFEDMGGGLPIEANTPPVPARGGRKAKTA